MDGAFVAYVKQRGCGRITQVVEDAKRRHAEDCQLRLARIANGKDPEHKNGR